MALTFGMTSLITYSMFTWLPTLLREAGASPAFGGTPAARSCWKTYGGPPARGTRVVNVPAD